MARKAGGDQAGGEPLGLPRQRSVGELAYRIDEGYALTAPGLDVAVDKICDGVAVYGYRLGVHVRSLPPLV